MQQMGLFISTAEHESLLHPAFSIAFCAYSCNAVAGFHCHHRKIHKLPLSEVIQRKETWKELCLNISQDMKYSSSNDSLLNSFHMYEFRLAAQQQVFNA